MTWHTRVLRWATILLVATLCRPAWADDARTTSAAWSRVFLTDGQVLTTWGEHARVDDQVVLQVPVGVPAPGAEPETRAVMLSASQVDWLRTDAWIHDARRTRADRARTDREYAVFTDDVAAELGDVARAADPAERLRRLEATRARVAAWPGAHAGHHAEDIAQTLSVIDDILNGMRAAAGQQTFALALSAGTAPAPSLETTTPPPTLPDVVTQTLALAARVGATDRLPLLESASSLLDRAEGVDSAWLGRTRREVSRQIAAERRVITAYVRLREWFVARTSKLIATADVRGLLGLRSQVERRDTKLKQQRPDDVTAMLATLDAQVEAARAYRLVLERWTVRRPVLERYASVVRRHVASTSALTRALTDVKALAGPDVALLSRAEGHLAGARVESELLSVPEEARQLHQVWVASHQLAARALQTRRTAVERADVKVAWEASAAAAGALLLLQQLRDDLDALVRRPSPPNVS